AELVGRTAEEVSWAEGLRGACEPEHHWRHRREFLLRNVGERPAAGSPQLQRLVSLSMVWANHVFLGCRTPFKVLWLFLVRISRIQIHTCLPVPTQILCLSIFIFCQKIAKCSEIVEGLEEPPKKRAVEKSKDSKETGKDGKTTKAEAAKEMEGALPRKQEKDTSKNPESSPSTLSSNQEMVAASDVETDGKPTNAENTAEHKPSSPEKESGENPPKEKAVAETAPQTTKSTPQTEVVAAAVPPATKSTPQAAAVPPATKSTPQAATVPPTTKSTPQAAAVPPTTKSTPQTSATLLSSKNQASAPASAPKGGTQAATSLLLAPKSSAQATTSLLLAPKSGAQAGTSLLLAAKGTAKAGSSLLASKSSAEVAASLLAARSGAQQGSSLLTSKSSAQVAASLLAARSGAQQGPSSLASRGGAQAGASLLATKGGAQAGSPQLASKSGSQAGESPARALCKPLTSEDAKERQPFFNRLYKAVAWKLVAVGGFSPNVNHAELLTSSIQSVKATLDVAFVPLKELADLPQNKSSLENIVCELRCKSVYLGTGCGKSMENAKAVASREALKLFLKKRVIVKICKRKYKGREIEDLVLLDEESKPSNLPPALRNPREIL
ncbi:CARF protein, partial [Rhinoptilus africanus]|nr:CARF protein [Rhinoptilus africanus]